MGFNAPTGCKKEHSSYKTAHIIFSPWCSLWVQTFSGPANTCIHQCDYYLWEISINGRVIQFKSLWRVISKNPWEDRVLSMELKCQIQEITCIHGTKLCLISKTKPAWCHCRFFQPMYSTASDTQSCLSENPHPHMNTYSKQHKPSNTYIDVLIIN